MPPPFRAYHNATAAQHQSWVNTLAPEGYHPISLSVYGDPGNALYAATGIRLRRLPVDRDVLAGRKEA